MIYMFQEGGDLILYPLQNSESSQSGEYCTELHGINCDIITSDINVTFSEGQFPEKLPEPRLEEKVDTNILI